jgi:hypothetical protein
MKTFFRNLSLGAALLALLVASLAQPVLAQTTSASLSGVVADTDGARIPGAAVTLRNSRTKDVRHVTSNGTGIFQFNTVPSGTYTITIVEKGFETLVTKDVELHPNDNANLSELRMKAGSQDISVTVEANTDMPTSGERSSLITAKDITKLSTVGRDVSELLRTQAGFAVAQNGLTNSTASSAEVAGAYSGLANYVGNGATANGASIISDGANVTDPGSGAGQTQTVNMDFVQEVKIETSNFGADTAKGPTVITAVGKSGGQSFHGDARINARTYQLNGQDWFQKFQGFSVIKDHYVYPGFDVGGPVIFPHSDFNKSRKLTFNLGAEDYVQRNVYAYGNLPESLLVGLVPTKAMLNGDFSALSLANYLGVTVPDIQGSGAYGQGCTPNGLLSTYLHLCWSPTGNGYSPGGQLANGINSIDPGVRALLRAYYEPNCTNTDLSSCPGPGPTKNFYNTQTLNLENPDSHQVRARIDYSLSDSDKMFFVYNGQFGTTSHIPEQIYYSPGTGGQATLGGVDTPGKTNSTISSNLGSANYTHVFNPRQTNELFIGISEVSNSYGSGNSKLMSKAYWNYPYDGIYPGASGDLPQVATYSSTGADILPFAITPDYSHGPFLSVKFLPSGGDNFSWVIKNHTLKLGVYFENDTANQTDLSPTTNGQISTYYLNGFTGCNGNVAAPANPPPNYVAPGCAENYLADFFEGAIGSFTQQNRNTSTDLDYWTASWFATDSWKVNSRFTLDYGVRFDHLGPWQEKHGLGMAVFNPKLYASDSVPTANPDGTAFLPGVRWHGGNNSLNKNAGDSAIPVSGVPSRWAFVSPRVGLSFDVFGTGKTLARGGWGMYRAHDSWNDFTGPAETAQGIVTVAAGGNSGYTTLSAISASGATLRCDLTSQTLCPSIIALDPSDNQQPLTETYSFSVTQRMPADAVFDIAYVGNQSTHLLTDNASTNAVQVEDLRDINAVPIGSFFKPDPNPASADFGKTFSPQNISQVDQNDYRPYPEYAHIGIPRHITYSNYNALQTSLNRQQGHLNYGLNYTFSKALGVRGAYNNGIAGDPTNLRANYGPLSFDRTSIVAASYSYDEGAHFSFKSRFLSGLSNNWLVSGITNLQSGPNLQAVYYPNFNLQGFSSSSYGGATCSAPNSNTSMPGSNSGLPNYYCNINNQNILGTADVMLQPTIRPGNGCPSGDPRSNLAKHQYVNGNCFGLPAEGVNGPTNLPYLHGPAFFNSDLTLQKTIPFNEGRNFQLRVAAFNFLNHPLTSFSSRFPSEANLRFYDPNDAGFAGVQLVAGQNPGGSCSDAGSECFGYAGFKTGRRVLEVSGRYNF